MRKSTFSWGWAGRGSISLVAFLDRFNGSSCSIGEDSTLFLVSYISSILYRLNYNNELYLSIYYTSSSMWTVVCKWGEAQWANGCRVELSEWARNAFWRKNHPFQRRPWVCLVTVGRSYFTQSQSWNEKEHFFVFVLSIIELNESYPRLNFRFRFPASENHKIVCLKGN